MFFLSFWLQVYVGKQRTKQTTGKGFFASAAAAAICMKLTNIFSLCCLSAKAWSKSPDCRASPTVCTRSEPEIWGYDRLKGREQDQTHVCSDTLVFSTVAQKDGKHQALVYSRVLFRLFFFFLLYLLLITSFPLLPHIGNNA